MKKLLLLIFFIFLVSCNQKAQTQNSSKPTVNMQKRDSIYGEKLIENYFLKYADNSKIDSLKIQLKNSFDIYDENNFKFAHIDAEELAEFNFGFFLPQLNKMLAKRNVNLVVKTANDYDTTNDIVINEEKLNLYTKKELDNQTFWDTSPRNFFKKVNELLKAKNSDEQFYLLYGGNDLQTLLLTDKQYLIILEYYKDDEKEKPYKP
ncbi:hypothetical protein [Paenimyroides baculatum]|uniref:Uncharacterized protein n=1 Tax=Paenimyroides baculatum TaxID=2608000 RepID=A0A5M6CR19_9FLAO|nr:hypothetical protein [Paenimyroides baculatum]KAA5535619.1 hypothetical protein F0460_07510 [Paenimyroides baculatum]